MDEVIRSVLGKYGRLAVDLATLTDNCDLYRCGLTSHAGINVMLALEDAFDVEFPDEMLLKRTFESVASIRNAVTELAGDNASAA